MTIYPAQSVAAVSARKDGTTIRSNGWTIVGGAGAISSPHDDLTSYVKYAGGFVDPFPNDQDKALEVYFGTPAMVDGDVVTLRGRVHVNGSLETGRPRLWYIVMDGLGRRANVSAGAHATEVRWDDEWAWTWSCSPTVQMDSTIGLAGVFDPSTGVYLYLIGASGNGAIESPFVTTTYTYLEMEVVSRTALDQVDAPEPFLALSTFGSDVWGYDALGDALWVTTDPNQQDFQGNPIVAWDTGEIEFWDFAGGRTVDGDHLSLSYVPDLMTIAGPWQTAEFYDVVGLIPNYETNMMVMQINYFDSEFFDCMALLEIGYHGNSGRVWDFGRYDLWTEEAVFVSGAVVGDVLTYMSNDDGNVEGSSYFGLQVKRIDLSQATPTVETVIADVFTMAPELFEVESMAVNPATGDLYFAAQVNGFAPDGTVNTYSTEFGILRFDGDGNFIERYDFVDADLAGFEVRAIGVGPILNGQFYLPFEGGWVPPGESFVTGHGINRFDLGSLVVADLSQPDEDRPYNVIQAPWSWDLSHPSYEQTGYTFGTQSWLAMPFSNIVPNLAGLLTGQRRTFDP